MGINFGTDGWRAVMSDKFTFGNVARVAGGIASFIHHNQQVSPEQGVVVGYDTRFMSEEFARVVAQVLAEEEIKVLLSDRAVPTPAVAYTITQEDLAGGVMITASHNPPYQNGIKFIPYYAGPATNDITNEIVSLIHSDDNGKWRDYQNSTLINSYSCHDVYLKHLDDMIYGIKSEKQLNIVVDPMFGAGSGYLEYIFTQMGHSVTSINQTTDPMFGGGLPEPKRDRLTDLSSKVVNSHADIGIALDGDADRFGVIDPEGNFITPNDIFGLITEYVCDNISLFSSQNSTESPVLARTVATTHIIDKIGKQKGYRVMETPVGFKHLATAMREHNAIFGAEESGGLGVNPEVPEKDGMAAAVLIIKILTQEAGSLLDLLNDINQKYGYYSSKRVDIYVSQNDKQKVLEKMEKTDILPTKIGGKAVIEVNTLNGVKIIFEDDTWCLIRPSGTENLIRIYGEAGSEAEVHEMIQAQRDIFQI